MFDFFLLLFSEEVLNIYALLFLVSISLAQRHGRELECVECVGYSIGPNHIDYSYFDVWYVFSCLACLVVHQPIVYFTTIYYTTNNNHLIFLCSSCCMCGGVCI